MTKRARELMETIREEGQARATEDEPLFFFDLAKAHGLRDDEADDVDTALTLRIMRSRGAV